MPIKISEVTQPLDRIHSALSALLEKAANDEVMTTSEIALVLDTSMEQIKKVRQRRLAPKYSTTVGSKAYFGHPKAIEQLRRRLLENKRNSPQG